MTAPTPAPPRPVDLCEVPTVDEPKVLRVRRDMVGDDAVLPLAETFRTLGDPTRLRIVYALMQEELCVCDLAAALDLSQSATSHSLRSLRQMRLVRSRKEGKVVYYQLDDEHIERLVSLGLEHVREGTA